MESIKRREKLYDWFMGGTLLSFVIVSFVVAYRWQVNEDVVGKIIIALFQTSLAAFLIMQIMKAADNLIRRRWITSYYIEEGANVLKVIGGVRINDISFLKSRLLNMRPDYMVVKNAYASFGCTLAAVPATPEHLHARKELKLHGVTI